MELVSVVTHSTIDIQDVNTIKLYMPMKAIFSKWQILQCQYKILFHFCFLIDNMSLYMFISTWRKHGQKKGGKHRGIMPQSLWSATLTCLYGVLRLIRGIIQKKD